MKRIMAAMAIVALMIGASAAAQDFNAEAKRIMERADVKRAFDYIEAHRDEILAEWKTITEINAPSGKERERAEHVKKLLESYGSRIRWRSEPDSGQGNAINRGFRDVDGDIMAYLNSDDMLLPEGKTPAYLGQAVAILIYHEFARFRFAKERLQFNDAVIRYGGVTGPLRRDQRSPEDLRLRRERSPRECARRGDGCCSSARDD